MARLAVLLKPQAVKDLAALPRREAARVLEGLSALEEGFGGDVKRLTNHSPEYRLRVGK